ncbi:MAG TPA: ATP-binding protein [Candidatus Dormibacteraeota bacterium]|nr:ATP-binding protein [Candidatus Dormibacteraeota bacterium]
MAEDGLGSRGVYIGTDLCGGGGSFVYDPWELSGRALTGPGMIVLGELGEGKSAIVKAYVHRQLAMGRRAVMLSVKPGENDRLCEAVGVAPIRLEPGAVRLNPLDPAVAGPEASAERIALDQLAVLQAIAEASLGRSLTPVERAACELALAQVATTTEEPVVPDVVAAMLRPSAEAADRIAMRRDQLAEQSRAAALELRRLCDGDLRGMFDGPTTGGIDLEAPLVSLDLSAVYSSSALAVLMACAAAWLHRAVTRPAAGRRILVVDEAWAILRNLGVARWLAASWKLARAHGVQCIAVTHRLSDLTAAGDAGSEQVQLARGLLADSETRVVHSLRPDELEASRTLLGLTDAEAQVIAALPRGCALWKVGQHSAMVEHLYSSRECWLIEPDGGTET